MGHNVIVYTDGGARGNPGPAAIGVVIRYDGKGKTYGERIGATTNNVAEYQAVIFALKKVKQLVGADECRHTAVEVRADSALLVGHMNREFKLKNEGLKDYFVELWNLTQDFGRVTFTHVAREENRGADKLVNQALDTLI